MNFFMEKWLDGMTIYNKAIRDKIPEITKESGNNCNIKTLSDEKFLIELEKKLDEELIEYHESKSVEELTDLIEIIQRIAELKGIDNKTLQELQKQKAKKRGKFKKNLFLLETDEKIWQKGFIINIKR